MSLREHLDRYCRSRFSDPISPVPMDNNAMTRFGAMQTTPPRSRSPARNEDGTTTATVPLSPFFAPPGWRPPPPRRIRPVLIEINIAPLRSLSTLIEGFEILDDVTTTHLLPNQFNSIYTVFKVIYYDYAYRFKISDLYTLITSTFYDRWNLHLPAHWFNLLVLTQGGTPGGHVESTTASRHPRPPSIMPIPDDTQSIWSFLNQFFPYWQTHQYRSGNRIRHPDDDSSAFHVELQCEPRFPDTAGS